MAKLPYLRREDLAPADRPILDEIARTRGRVGRPFQVLAHSPDLTRRVAALGEYVRYHTSIPRPLNELAILVVGRHYDCQFEFTDHAPIARAAGTREEAIQAVAQRRAPAGLTEEEALVVRFAQELTRDRKLSDRTWDQAVKRFGTKGTIDLAATIAYYAMMCHFLLAFEVGLEPGEKAELPGGR